VDRTIFEQDPDQGRGRNAEKNWRMAKRFSTTELVAIAIIVLSVAFLAFVGFSIWTEP